MDILLNKKDVIKFSLYSLPVGLPRQMAEARVRCHQSPLNTLVT